MGVKNTRFLKMATHAHRLGRGRADFLGQILTPFVLALFVREYFCIFVFLFLLFFNFNFAV